MVWAVIWRKRAIRQTTALSGQEHQAVAGGRQGACVTFLPEFQPVKPRGVIHVMIRTTITRFSTFLVAFTLLLSAQFASADVSGNWTFAVDIGGQTGNATVTMAQAADGKITGHYTGQLGDTDFEGTATGNDFQFVLVGELGSVTYKGALQENGTLTGNVDLGGMASGTFTARKSG